MTSHTTSTTPLGAAREPMTIQELLAAHNLCHALRAVAELGIAERLVGEGVSVAAVARDSSLNARLLGALLRHLAVRDVVELVDEERQTYQATDLGVGYLSAAAMAAVGYYHEAYGPILGRIGDLVSGRQRYGAEMTRDAEALGRHCEQLFRGFGLPVVSAMVARSGARHVLDLGCGTGGLVIDLLARHPGLRASGIDIAPDAIATARARASGAEFHVADAFDLSTWPDNCLEADCLIAVGALHEHFRDGEEAVVAVLGSYAEFLAERPGGQFLLCEPSLQVDAIDVDFYLLHELTDQGLPRPATGWLPLFEASGLTCVEQQDSLGSGFRFSYFRLAPRGHGALPA